MNRFLQNSLIKYGIYAILIHAIVHGLITGGIVFGLHYAL
jgi:hypothetical protein